MLNEPSGGRPGLLARLHEEHEEAASLLERILEADEAKERTALFAELREKLIPHLRAESKVLYAKLAKDENSRDFALEGDIEHDLAIEQMEELNRARAKSSDAWLARVKVLKDMVEHHVEEEENRGFSAARERFDESELERLTGDFEREKKRMAEPAGRRRSVAEPAYAGRKPKAGAKRSARRTKR